MENTINNLEKTILDLERQLKNKQTKIDNLKMHASFAANFIGKLTNAWMSSEVPNQEFFILKRESKLFAKNKKHEYNTTKNKLKINQ